MTECVDWTNPAYKKRWMNSGQNRYNGAYYYAREIKELMMPRIETQRPWVLVNQPGECFDGAIVFIHNNMHPKRYEWLSAYCDLILVCGVPDTVRKVRHLGHAAYLPLSIDVRECERHRRPKDKGRAYVGRKSKRAGCRFAPDVDILEGKERSRLLDEMARYREVYAVGRCAIEARVLGCEVLPYDERYPDPSLWRVRDTLEMVPILQGIIDKVDRI